MLHQSASISAMTHWDPQAETCCAVYCLWLEAILKGQERGAAWKAAIAQAKASSSASERGRDTPGGTPLPCGFWERLARASSLSYADLQPSRYAGYVVECLEAAVWCAVNAGDLEEALVRAVNLAGEADTIAAGTGAAVGAYWRAGSVPDRWFEKLYRQDHIINVGRSLYDLRKRLNACR
jgi:ADP-ribosyl-[dinitrogen reductase] hydrolase